MSEKETIHSTYEKYFKVKMKPYSEMATFFDNETRYLHYMKKVLYFTKAVIEPLEKKGMKHEDAILDIASGDGQMSLALCLLGYRNITLYDIDQKYLQDGLDIIKEFFPDVELKSICDSAMNLHQDFDIIISYQTIEHLSGPGDFLIAEKKYQKVFLGLVNTHIQKLIYFNAPNNSYYRDGHDTGKILFHRLPLSWKKYFFKKGWVKRSWPGICKPVSVSFLNRKLSNFKLATKYYAFDNMIDYIDNYPPYDYMGTPVHPIDTANLSKKKKFINGLSKMFGKNMQKMLPTLSVIYQRKG